MTIDPAYLSGDYFNKSTAALDAPYKVDQLRRLLAQHPGCLPAGECRIADVGCGSGRTTWLLQEMVQAATGSRPAVDGYDVHPYIESFPQSDSVRFLAGDFAALADGMYDLAVLFDVVEHVPDPLHFLRDVSRHARLLALHIPLDDSLMPWLRHLPRQNLEHPGHLLVLDTAAAINLLTFAGLRILDFSYSPGFRSPSGRATRAQKALYPLRSLLYGISPYLTQKLLSTVSLNVLAWTAAGLERHSTVPV